KAGRLHSICGSVSTQPQEIPRHAITTGAVELNRIIEFAVDRETPHRAAPGVDHESLTTGTVFAANLDQDDGVISHRPRVGAGAGLCIPVNDDRFGYDGQWRFRLDGMYTRSGNVEADLIRSFARIPNGVGVQDRLAQRARPAIVRVGDREDI